MFMLTASALASQENLLSLLDQSKEGRDILNSIYLQLHTTGANLQRGKIVELLSTVKSNANKSELRQKKRNKRAKKNCKSDLSTLKKHVNENERHEYTINRHLNANKHATNKNKQFIQRSQAELNQYTALSNLVKANKKTWLTFINKRIQAFTHIIKLLKKVKKHLINAHKAAMGSEFVEIQADVLTNLAELNVEFTNTDDHLDGYRPIIANLLQNMRSPVIGKNVLRSRLIKLIKNTHKALAGRRDFLEQQHEGANSYFEALLKSFEENKLRVSKLLERLAHERNLLEARQKALNDAYKRAHHITVLSIKAKTIRGRQCNRVKVRRAKLHVNIQKIRSTVAQIEEILQERFGALKSFFLQRKMKFD